MSYIGYTLYTVTITIVVVLPMLFILEDEPEAFYIVFILGCFCANASALLFLFLPKCHVIVLHPSENVLPVDADGRVMTGRGGTTTQ